MGYRKVPTIYTLTDVKGMEGAVIRMRSVKVGRLRRLLSALESEGDFSESISPIAQAVSEGLVSWDLEDETGVPIPTSVEGVEELELADLMNLVSAWTERMTGVDEDLGKDSRSGEQFPGRPVTMEAL